MKPLFILTVFIIPVLASCQNDNTYSGQRERVKHDTSWNAIWKKKVSRKKEMSRDKVSRMDRIRRQGCIDNSADCGFPVNWGTILTECEPLPRQASAARCRRQEP